MATDIHAISPDISSAIQPDFFVSFRFLGSITESGAMGNSIDLSGDGGVFKSILRNEKADAICPSEDLPLVDVQYEGMLAETGEVFDTTREDNTVFSFELGKGSVIQAWEIAVKTMKVGEVAKITCKPEYAYGNAGSPPDIPPEYVNNHPLPPSPPFSPDFVEYPRQNPHRPPPSSTQAG
ncbi:hypothetical protein POTOM_031126 [Populus tomentosa]|uniref:peptidylprolyl isomerase n=1 Tax=Populus tomentosa TaxID=118781 RepID=A0A8X7ZI07_POPTO|nr:hypothetical protein POTOM_031126 [Populus tomentosa]